MLAEELCKGERCVQALVELVGSNFSTVSKHLSILKEAGIVVDERRGQQIYYSVKLPCVAKSLECARSIATRSLKARMDALEAAGAKTYKRKQV
jgi:ArsR family transcriptional regulator